MEKVNSVHCSVFSVQCTVQYGMVQYSKVVLLMLWREHQCTSVWGVEPFAMLLLCLTPLEEVVQIVRQGGSNCPTNLILLNNLEHFLAKIQGGPNSPTKRF